MRGFKKMKTIPSRKFLKLLLGLFVICGILSYQNCASQGSGAATFSIALGSTSPGALTMSAISLASPTVQVATAYTAAVTLTGADLSGISCTWSLDSGSTLIGTSVVTQANSNSVCVAALTAPATAGSYTLSVIATNAGGEVVNGSVAIAAQSGAVAPSYTLTLSSSSPAAYVNETVTLTGTALANVAGAYAVSIGKTVSGVQTLLAGCSTSSTGTTLTFTCPVTFTTLGVQSLYINLSQGASVVQSCTAPSANCLGTAYSITVQSVPSGGGGSGGGCKKQVNGLVVPICGD
jgi:hypothetical protein